MSCKTFDIEYELYIKYWGVKQSLEYVGIIINYVRDILGPHLKRSTRYLLKIIISGKIRWRLQRLRSLNLEVYDIALYTLRVGNLPLTPHLHWGSLATTQE